MKTLLLYLRLTALFGMMAVSLPSAFAQFTIEAEDFNYDSGQFIDNPTAGDYSDKGLQAGAPGIDFKENTPSARSASDYRSPRAGSPGLPQTATSDDAARVAGTADYDLSSIERGEWVNYTRTFPAGDYRVTAQLQAIDLAEPFIARLEKVTTDPKAPTQNATAYGLFLGRNASAAYGPLEMTEINETPVTITLNGEETLRLSAQFGSFNINYLTFTPVAAAQPMPTVNITSPANEIGVAPDSSLEITLTPGNPEEVAAVQVLANSLNGDTEDLGQIDAPPYTLTWEGVPEGTWFVQGIVASTSGLVGVSSEITIFADDTPPELQQARGRTIEDVVLTFSEPLAQATAGDPANYSIIDADGTVLEVLNAGVTADGRVILATAVQSVGKGYTVTVNNITDPAGNMLPNDTTAEFTGNGPLLQTSLGFVVFEAEQYDRNLDELWIEETEFGTPSEGVYMIVPNGGGGSESETKLEYDIKFVKTGTHYLWYRASGDSGNDDSAWLHLDGERPAERLENNTASMSGFGSTTDFVWASNAQDGGGQMSFDIASPGFHTISIARREDGSRFDKFVITTDSAFTPADPAFGDFGPALTPREGEEVVGGGNQVQITLDPSDVSGVEHDAITVEADGSGTEGEVIVFQWQRKEGDAWADIPGVTGTIFPIDRVELDWNGAIVRMAIRADGAEAFSGEATISITPDVITPTLLAASGNGERVNLVFS
ncbi:MAG: hypothetical protein ACI8T1_003476, partial [Verrucomicrobiales bacterium]